ncbi:MAG: hypothetical protein AAF711_09130 [Planctomycetota bacterium]
MSQIIKKKGFVPDEVFSRLSLLEITGPNADIKRIRRSIVDLVDSLDGVINNVIETNKDWRKITNAAQVVADRTGE